ncbi:Transferrin receptor protein 2 [Rhynchospora pubera]|uniref:glutamate carboxypeptidase II n=1 Tax=Rhynchospora pubera TaxID=906938 RepID=A0AAV8H6F6_9POAL|nr:Transferrin receptor protein 2 [Rhynchospora pubera]
MIPISPRKLSMNHSRRVLLPFSLLLISFLVYTVLHSHSFTSSKLYSLASATSSVSLFLSLSPSANASISHDLRSLTLRPHLAGTPGAASTASFVLSRLRRAGLETFSRRYSPLLSFPSHSSLSLHHANGSLITPLSLSEPADPNQILVPPYHAYSPSGEALAPAVYANLGREEDFETLERLGVRVNDCVVLVRKGGGYRGGVVARAAERGAKAVLISGGPDGGVERGTVILGGPGDPLTPGWGAIGSVTGSGDVERLELAAEEVRRRFPTIPSMPVAAVTAAEILRTIGGAPLPPEWKEGLVETGAGVGPGPTLVNFTYTEERKVAEIQDVFGMIRGREEPDRYIVLGNHRDAWTYGAVDPHSGTATLLDIARRFGVMLRSGWRPRRTIILCSWDAEEFGMIGSTEWVEENLDNLHSKAVAYLNVDCAVQGVGFNAAATPQLDKLLIDITKKVNDPDVEGKTVYDTWVSATGGISIERLARADSDFTGFLHHAGIPSLDMYYGNEFAGYHTALDSFGWMETKGDPLFHRHLAIAEIWGLFAIRLADDLILPFDYQSYASQLEDYVHALRDFLDEKLSLEPIHAAIMDLHNAANYAFTEGQKLELQQILGDDAILRIRTLNDRLMLAERSFLQEEGLDGRHWFKHLLYSPPEDYESKLSFFTSIADALSRSKRSKGREEQFAIQRQIWLVTRAIRRVGQVLRGDVLLGTE